MFKKILLDEIASTSNHAKRLIREGTIVEPTVVCAKRQTAGRGSRGRTWTSIEGNLLATFVFEPPCEPKDFHLLVYSLSLATLDCVKAVCGKDQRAQVKWPNDILLNGAKVSGSLHEVETGPEKRFFVAGIGVNLVHSPNTKLIYKSTSLKEQDCNYRSTEEHLEFLSSLIWDRVSQFSQVPFSIVRTEFLSNLHGLNEHVQISVSGSREDSISGIFLGIDGDGRMELRQDAGQIKKISTGTIFQLY